MLPLAHDSSGPHVCEIHGSVAHRILLKNLLFLQQSASRRPGSPSPTSRRQVVFSGDGLYGCIGQPVFQRAYRCRIAFEYPIGKGIDLIDRYIEHRDSTPCT